MKKSRLNFSCQIRTATKGLNMKLLIAFDLVVDHSGQHFFYIETSQLIFIANKLSCFFVTLALYDLKTHSQVWDNFATEILLKMIKNTFYFTIKAVFILKIFWFLSWLFGHVAKRLDWKDKFNFKIYDATPWLTNNCNTYIAQYLEK